MNPKDLSLKTLALDEEVCFHESLELPGKIEQSIRTEVVTENNELRRMDLANIVLPAGQTKSRCAQDYEFQAKFPNNVKQERIHDYVTSTTSLTKLPCMPLLIGNFGKRFKKHDEVCLQAKEFKFNAFVRNVVDDEVKKRLNSITNKVNNNEKFLSRDAYDIAFTAIFASGEIAEDMIEKAVEMFCNAQIDDLKVKINVRQALTNMIKHIHKGNDAKIEEMIKMMIQKVTEKEKEELGQYYRFEEYIEADQVEIAFLNEQNENKDRTIAKMDKMIANMDKMIANMDNTIANLNKTIEDLRKDNENLKIQLKDNQSN